MVHVLRHAAESDLLGRRSNHRRTGRIIITYRYRRHQLRHDCYVRCNLSGTVDERKEPHIFHPRIADFNCLPDLLRCGYISHSDHDPDRYTAGGLTMTIPQQIITIAMCVLGTMATRFLPFIIFNEKRKTPEFVQYLGKFLPSAVFGILVIYCLKNVSLFHGTHGLPEGIAILVTAALHFWKRNMLISIAGGTICYMLLLHFVFI